MWFRYYKLTNTLHVKAGFVHNVLNFCKSDCNDCHWSSIIPVVHILRYTSVSLIAMTETVPKQQETPARKKCY